MDTIRACLVIEHSNKHSSRRNVFLEGISSALKKHHWMLEVTNFELFEEFRTFCTIP